MYIQNRRVSCKFKGCSPLQLCNGLTHLEPTIAYFAYTKRYAQCNQQPYQIQLTDKAQRLYQNY